MNIKEIKEMIILMNENSLLELEIEKDGMKIRLKKESPHEQRLYAPQNTLSPQISVTQEPAITQSAQQNIKTVEIKSPMVGTFYRAPTSESPPFTETGQTVEIGQVVCIVEAMKLMNEIKSEIRGKIVEVIAENGHPIEFGQPLFLVEPA